MNKPLLLLFCVLMVSCTRSYKIEGHSSISQMDGHMLYLKTLQEGEWLKLDSADIVHGQFGMTGKLDSLVMTMLYIGETPLMPLVLEKGSISIDITDNRLVASGTSMNDALYRFIEKQNSYETKMVDLEREEARLIMAGMDINDVQETLTAELETLLSEMNDCVQNFILEHADDILGPNVFMMLCGSLPYPIITPEIQTILDEVPLSFKKNWMVKEFIKEAEENKLLIEESQRISASN